MISFKPTKLRKFQLLKAGIVLINILPCCNGPWSPADAQAYGTHAVVHNLTFAFVSLRCHTQLHGLAEVALVVVADVDTAYGVVVEMVQRPVV